MIEMEETIYPLTRSLKRQNPLLNPHNQQIRLQPPTIPLLQLLLQSLQRVSGDPKRCSGSLECQAADASTDPFHKTCGAFALSARVGLGHKTGDAVEETVVDFLGGYFDAGSEACDVIAAADGVVGEEEGWGIVEAVGEVVEECYWD